MFKTKKWYNGKIELIIISLCIFLLLLTLEIVLIFTTKNSILKILPFFILMSLILSVQIYKILAFTILQHIVNEYFDLSHKVKINDFNYSFKLKKIDEYVDFYKKIFTKCELEIIYFTRELVTKHIEYKNNIKNSNYITSTN